LRWLEERPADQPWFLYFPLLSVHTPVDAPVEFKQQYHDRTYFEDPKINESFVRFAAMTTHMDDAIGRLIEAVEARSELENTIIIFFSDNGGVVLEEGRSSGDQYAGAPVLDSWRLGSNEPLRGQKATMWEGGIRVPALVYWQGTLAPRKVETPLSVVDLMPTLLNLAGYEEKRDLKMDGLDIRPTLSGQEQDLSGRAIYIRYIGGMGVVRRGPWKLLKMGTSDFARNRMPGKDRSDRLYNIEEDPLEERDLAAEHPEIVAELNEIYEQNQHLDMPLRDPFVPVFQER
jgi:arylsulfatase A-like enzyme